MSGGGSPSSNYLSDSDSGEIGGGYDDTDMVSNRMPLGCTDSVSTKSIAADEVGAGLGVSKSAVYKGEKEKDQEKER